MDQIDRIIQREGGNRITDIPGDPGGVTKYGISTRSHPELDIPNLTYNMARTVYMEDYLRKPKIDILPQPLQEQMLDFAVHSGPVTAIKKLQMILNLDEDGVLTDEVVGRINATGVAKVHNALVKTRILFLMNINKPQFWRGWIRRAIGFIL